MPVRRMLLVIEGLLSFNDKRGPGAPRLQAGKTIPKTLLPNRKGPWLHEDKQLHRGACSAC